MIHPSRREPIYLFMVATNCCPNIHKIVEQMLEFAKSTEQIKIYEWTGHKWYIDVVDKIRLEKARQQTGFQRSQDAISATRFMLSVDVRGDCVVWNNQGGNCMIRGRRWKPFAEQTFANLDGFHEYQDHRTLTFA